MEPAPLLPPNGDLQPYSTLAEADFDKYALFCEEYIAEMFRTLTTLTRDGPGNSAAARFVAPGNQKEVGSVADPDTRRELGRQALAKMQDSR